MYSRKIIHIDCDCFFAAIEIRDHPHLRGLPVAVGGSASKHGVLSTCNYEARRFGLHSAMPTAKALKLCPQLVLLPHRFAAYKEASLQVRRIFQQYCNTIEPVSLDEAYLDVSDSQNASLIAQNIRRDIAKKVGITASAGVSVNKFLAKVASDWQKPNGQFVIKPDAVEAFVKALPVKKIPGVGKAGMLKMQQLGIENCADLQQLELYQLLQQFGVFGKRLYEYARGMDSRPVRSQQTRKSLSVETTFEHDLSHNHQIQGALQALLNDLSERCEVLGTEYVLHKAAVKVRFADFTTMTAEKPCAVIDEPIYSSLLASVLQKKNQAIRLLGLAVGVRPRQTYQLDLFEDFAD